MGEENAACLGLDWGTSSLRACLLGGDGAMIDYRASDEGITNVADGDFDATLLRLAGDWLRRQPALPVIASGMIGSRQGWIEAPYAQCPAGAGDVASAVVEHRMSSGHTITFVPGVKVTGSDGVPDVIRGEETQIFGALEAPDGAPRTQGLFVLPGTHSKWVWVHASQIVSFATFMTGEVFDVLHKHSILGRQMSDSTLGRQISDSGARDGADNLSPAWRRGLEYGLSKAPHSGGVLKRLFSTRTLGLFGELDPPGAHDYLSGLLIGAEVGEALACVAGREMPGEVVIIGGSSLTGRYEAALNAARVRAVRGPADAASYGHWRIAHTAGLMV